MNQEQDLLKRKRNRLEKHDYSSCGAYFVTICTAERRNYFWENVGAIIDRPQNVVLSNSGSIVEEAIKTVTPIYSEVLVEHYVIMPNHIHLLIRIRADEFGRPMVAPTISRVIKQMKGYVTKKVGFSLWQKSFHDHVIRNREDYEEHVKYIYENPKNWYYDELYTEK